jgi:hypothetical protein
MCTYLMRKYRQSTRIDGSEYRCHFIWRIKLLRSWLLCCNKSLSVCFLPCPMMIRVVVLPHWECCVMSLVCIDYLQCGSIASAGALFWKQVILFVSSLNCFDQAPALTACDRSAHQAGFLPCFIRRQSLDCIICLSILLRSDNVNAGWNIANLFGTWVN